MFQKQSICKKTGNMTHSKNQLSPEESENLILTLQTRFEKHSSRHKNINWTDVEPKLISHSQKLVSLLAMENTGGEPDVIGYEAETNEYIFCDCSAESPTERRNVCYDRAALESRKEHRPWHSAMALAEEMGIELLTEEQYRDLQKIGKFDSKTSSWIKTPEDIRALGGALFADFRYGHVFIYHNGAQSYYGVRGFRGLLKV